MTGAASRLTTDTIVERDPDVFDAIAGNDIVMVRIESGSYYGVSDVSRTIWESIKRPTRVSDVVASLSSTYHVDDVRCEKETLEFLERLLAERLIRIINESLV